MEQNLKNDIATYLKSKYEYHCLVGEKLVHVGKLKSEVVHFLPDMFIPEINVPIESTPDKERDDKYMQAGYLPMVIVKKNLRVDVHTYIDVFLDFHKKWRAAKI